MVTTTLARQEGMVRLSAHLSRYTGMLRVTATLRGSQLWAIDLPARQLSATAQMICEDSSDPGLEPAEPDLIYSLWEDQTAIPTRHGICWHSRSHPRALISTQEVRRLAAEILEYDGCL